MPTQNKVQPVKAQTPTPTPEQVAVASGAPVAVAKPVAPALDLTAFKPAAVKLPERKVTPGAGRTPRDNSVVEGWLADLDKTRGTEKVSKEARALTVPAAGLAEMQSRFVTASGKLKVGVSLSLEDGRKIADVIKAAKDGKETGQVTLIYFTKTRKQNKAKTPTPAPTAPAAPVPPAK
jgi:hypothetical protein